VWNFLALPSYLNLGSSPGKIQTAYGRGLGGSGSYFIQKKLLYQ